MTPGWSSAFGTTAALFDAVSDIALGLDAVMDGPPEQLGERVLRHALTDVDGECGRRV